MQFAIKKNSGKEFIEYFLCSCNARIMSFDIASLPAGGTFDGSSIIEFSLFDQELHFLKTFSSHIPQSTCTSNATIICRIVNSSQISIELKFDRACIN